MRSRCHIFFVANWLAAAAVEADEDKLFEAILQVIFMLGGKRKGRTFWNVLDRQEKKKPENKKERKKEKEIVLNICRPSARMNDDDDAWIFWYLVDL